MARQMAADTDTSARPEQPRVIRMHPNDNVAIVVNDFGLPAGTQLPSGPTLRERVPQAHKVALVDIAEGAPVRRYDVVIGYAAQALPAGSWVNEQRLVMPIPPALEGLPIATDNAQLGPALEGYTFEGYRNPDGSVGTRNILAITTTVQCVSGVVEHAVRRIRNELLPKYPHVDDVVGLEHIYGCGVAIEADDADIPIRTLRNISFNPNFGGGTMVVSLGCEKLQPERLLPAGAARGRAAAGSRDYDLITLQDPSHVGFDAMVGSIMATAEQHLEVLDRRRRETCPASAVVVGMQCGGSDAFSGVTANPALGFASDLLVRAGATVMFSEDYAGV
jgi:galactarate dehydratase